MQAVDLAERLSVGRASAASYPTAQFEGIGAALECQRTLTALRTAKGRELPFDPADINVLSGIQIARSRQSVRYRPGRATR